MSWLHLVVLLVLGIWVWGLNLRQRWRLRAFPGPKPAWLTGNLSEVRKQIWPLQNAEWHEKYGKVVRVFLGREPAVIISDPDLAREVGIRQFAAFHDRPPVPTQRIWGKRGAATNAGMLTARGTAWSTVRAAAQPMFHSGSLKSYIADMEPAVAKLVEEIGELTRKEEPFDVKAPLERMTMQVIGGTAFGVDFGAQRSPGEPDAPLLAAARELFRGRFNRFWGLAFMVLPAWLVGPLPVLLAAIGGTRRTDSENATKLLNNTSANLLANARAAQATASGQQPPTRNDAEWKWWHDDGSSPYQDATPKENSLIAMMLRTKTKGEGRPLRDMEIMAQTNTFIAAGFETTSVALTFAVYLLARHPDAEAKLLAEVDRLPRDRQLTHEELEGLQYTAAVIDESLRLYPPAVNSRRQAPHDTQVGPWRIPAGIGVFVDIWSIHRDPELWPRPEEFRPERFIDPVESKARHPQAFLPFGLGPRNCIGYKFALQEARLALVRLYQNFLFRLADPDAPLQLRYSITISPIGGLPVVASRRQLSQ